MTLPSRIQHSCDQMRAHLEQFDWSEMTSGRRQILAAFLSLVIEQGYTSVTMRGLAKAIDVKASSIYFHFPGGRDEIIGETLRWHYHNWGTAILEATKTSQSADEFWENLIRVHIKRQVELRESDLWDILVAMDRMYSFLRSDFQAEIRHWLDLCTRLYEAAAQEMGYSVGPDVARAVLKLVDSATAWCDLEVSRGDPEPCAKLAIAMTRAILSSEADNKFSEPLKFAQESHMAD